MEKSTRFVLELPFEPRGRDSFHEVLLTHDKYDKTWHQRQYRHGKHRTPIGLRAGIKEQAQTQRHGVFANVTQVDQLTEEVVPCPQERKDHRGNQCWESQWNDDFGVYFHRTTSINGCRLIQLFRQSPEELYHEKNEEGVCRQPFWHHKRQIRIHPLQVVEENILRDQRHMMGQHDRHEHQAKADGFETKIQSGEGIRRHRAGNHIAQHRAKR